MIILFKEENLKSETMQIDIDFDAYYLPDDELDEEESDQEEPFDFCEIEYDYRVERDDYGNPVLIIDTKTVYDIYGNSTVTFFVTSLI